MPPQVVGPMTQPANEKPFPFVVPFYRSVPVLLDRVVIGRKTTLLIGCMTYRNESKFPFHFYRDIIHVIANLNIDST